MVKNVAAMAIVTFMAMSSTPVTVPQDGSSCTIEDEYALNPVQKALKFLSSNQKADGSWEPLQKEADKKLLMHGKMHVVLTGLCGLAFIAEGSTLEKGTYKDNLTKAVRFLLDDIQADGSSKVLNQNPKNIHMTNEVPFAVYFLNEVYRKGEADEKLRQELKEKLQAVAAHIEKGQAKSGKLEGGWPYQYKSSQNIHTQSTTQNLLAVALLKESGFTVGENVIKKAIKCLKSQQQKNGNFGYGWKNNNETNRAAGVIACMEHLAVDKDDQVYTKALEYHKGNLSKYITNGHSPGFQHFFTAIAAGILGKDDWKAYENAFKSNFEKSQKEDGHWDVEKGKHDAQHPHGGMIYDTAIKAFILQIPQANLVILNSKK